MKKILLSIAVILIAVSASAKRPTGLNIGGGFEVNSICYPSSAILFMDGPQTYEGFYAEVGYDLTFTKHSTLYFGGRFDWMMNSHYTSATYEGKIMSADMTNHHFFFDIPIKYQLNFNVSSKTKLYLEAGPTVQFWLVNRARFDERDGSTATITKKNMFDFDAFNRVNLGLGGAFGVHFGHVKIYFGYDQYLFSMLKSDLPFTNCANFRLGAAYVF